MNWVLLKNSLCVSGFATLLAAGFGVVAAICLMAASSRGRSLLLAFAIVALALPPFLVTNCWLHFLGHTGVWRSWLPWDIFSLGGTFWILGLMLWPITMLAVGSAWQRIEPAQLENDAAISGWALFRWLLFPLARPALGQAAFLTFVLALNNFAVPAILQVKVAPAEMWVRFNTTLKSVEALRMSWPLVLGPLLFLLWSARRGFPLPHLQGSITGPLFRRQLGLAGTLLCMGLTSLLCGLAVGLPLFQILSLKRTWTELPGAFAAGQNAVWNSFWSASVSATVIVIVGMGLLLSQPSQGRSRDSGWVLQKLLPVASLLVWLPFLLPGVILGIVFIAVFNRGWSALFYESAGIVILAFGIRYFALGWRAVALARAAVDPDLLAVAHLEGATRWQVLRHAQWPQIRTAVAAVWYVLYLLCLWDVETILLVVPPGGETLALRVFNLLHYGHNAQVDALCLVLLVLALAPLVAWKIGSAMRAAQPILGVVALGFAASFIVSGCAPASPPRDTSVQSQLFSRVEIIGSRGVGVGQLNKPRSVAVDRRDNLYVVDMTGRVQKFSSNGVFLLSWQMPQTDLGKPKGMCCDRDGNIVVIEPHYSRVNHFSPEGNLVSQWGERGTNDGQLSVPRAAAMNSRREIFVSEYQGRERIQKFAYRLPSASVPAPVWLLSLGHAGNGPEEFNRPEGLCVDAHDRIYVADSCNHRIQVFSSDGTFLRAYGKPGKGKGELSYPYDICVGADGLQYVCEFGNSRVQVFDGNDQPLEILGGPGARPGQFSNPWGVALDSAGNLYVADSQNHRVQKFLRQTRRS